MEEIGKNIHIIIIGFDEFKDSAQLPPLRYAQDDAEDLYDVFINSKYGDYPLENITLITQRKLCMTFKDGVEYDPKLLSLVNGFNPVVGISTNDIKEILYTQAVVNRKKDDVVIIYYSGHGFKAGKKNKSYLATPDITNYQIRSNPEAGLQMEYIYETIFGDTPAKNVIMILDCCYSGTFINESQENLLDLRDFKTGGKIAIVSSPRDVISRESKDFKHGVFTHYLLEGLKGADPEASGEITVISLFSYIQRMCPKNQPPSLYGEADDRIVLTRCRDFFNSVKPVHEIPYEDIRNNIGKRYKESTFVPLINPLDDQIAFADIIKDCIQKLSVAGNTPVGNRILSSIRCALDAELVFVIRIDDSNSNKILYKYESDLSFKGYDIDQYKALVITDVFPYLLKPKKELLESRYGYSRQFQGRKDVSKYIVVIPLHLMYPREFLIVCGVNSEQLKYGEILGRALASVYDATRELTSLPEIGVETAILDDIKRDFGHVPYPIYDRRYELFKAKLKTIYFAFEPVVKIRRRKPEIHSWEALARDPDTHRAPGGLFRAAELWGPQFITELDLYCLQTAVKEYLELWQEKKERFKKNTENPLTIKEDPLAINVYPDSLFRDAYKHEVAEIFQKELLSEDRFILEISEKRPLPSVDRISESIWGYKDPVLAFVNRIHEYTKDLKIRFAIDDFGVGHSSIVRMGQLKLDYIKIDRDILLQIDPGLTLDYVNKFLNTMNVTRPSHIVVEGFDNDSQITLKQILEKKIEYVQGHLIRRATRSVDELSYEESKYITEELSDVSLTE